MARRERAGCDANGWRGYREVREDDQSAMERQVPRGTTGGGELSVDVVVSFQMALTRAN